MESINGPLRIEIDARRIEKIAERVQRFYVAESGAAYPLWAVIRSVRTWLAVQTDAYLDDVAEMLTTPNRDEARSFESMLSAALAESKIIEPEQAEAFEEADVSVFTGFREFSAERLGAMALYIANKGKDIYKTKLNKLLFYSDFINFYLHGRSISGAKYIHVPFGPVPQQYGDALAQLAEAGRLQLLPAGPKAILIRPVAKPALPETELTTEETASIDWVLETYGKLSSSEISDLSHREKAYRFTRPGEEIAYRYAAFFETLPFKES